MEIVVSHSDIALLFLFTKQAVLNAVLCSHDINPYNVFKHFPTLQPQMLFFWFQAAMCFLMFFVVPGLHRWSSQTKRDRLLVANVRYNTNRKDQEHNERHGTKSWNEGVVAFIFMTFVPWSIKMVMTLCTNPPILGRPSSNCVLFLKSVDFFICLVVDLYTILVITSSQLSAWTSPWCLVNHQAVKAWHSSTSNLQRTNHKSRSTWASDATGFTIDVAIWPSCRDSYHRRPVLYSSFLITQPGIARPSNPEYASNKCPTNISLSGDYQTLVNWTNILLFKNRRTQTNMSFASVSLCLHSMFLSNYAGKGRNLYHPTTKIEVVLNPIDLMRTQSPFVHRGQWFMMLSQKAI